MKTGRGFDFYGFSYKFLSPYMKGIEKYFLDLRGDILKAGIPVNYKGYLAGMVFASVLSGFAGLLVGLGLSFFIETYIWIKALLPIGIALLCSFSTFSAFYFRPKIVADSRKRRLNEELPYVIGHMAVLAAAGLTPERIFQSIAEEESNDVINQEARKIVRDIKLLGMDLNQALMEARRRSPSDSFAEFLDGFIGASKSGADIRSFLVRAAQGMMEDRKIKARQFGETVGVIAEMYTIVLVVTPLILIIMFSVMGIIAGSLGGVSILILISIVAYVLVPVGGLMVMILADSIMPKM